MPAPAGNKFSPGRRPKYTPVFDEQARKLCMMGHTDVELAEFFEVHIDTIYTWKKTHLSFSEAIKSGKAVADANVVESLYNRAMGYSHDDTYFSTYEGIVSETPTIKHYPPDTTAIIFWLKNRQPRLWRDKHELAVETKGTHRVRRDEENGDIIIEHE